MATRNTPPVLEGKSIDVLQQILPDLLAIMMKILNALAGKK